MKPLVSKDVERTKLLDPGPCHRTAPKEPPPIKMTLRCPPAAAVAPAKAKGRKQSKNKKPSKKKEEKKELRGLLGSQGFTDKSGKRKLHMSSNGTALIPERGFVNVYVEDLGSAVTRPT